MKWPKKKLTLPSGRIMLFNSSMTDAELNEAQQPENIAMLEVIADYMTQTWGETLTPADPEYHKMLEENGITDSPETNKPEY